MDVRIAQQKAQFDAEFSGIDKKGDSKLDKAEASVGNPLLGTHFDAIDTDKDSFVTPNEIRAAILASQKNELPKS